MGDKKIIVLKWSTVNNLVNDQLTPNHMYNLRTGKCRKCCNCRTRGFIMSIHKNTKDTFIFFEIWHFFLQYFQGNIRARGIRFSELQACYIHTWQVIVIYLSNSTLLNVCLSFRFCVRLSVFSSVCRKISDRFLRWTTWYFCLTNEPPVYELFGPYWSIMSFMLQKIDMWIYIFIIKFVILHIYF